MPGVYHEEEQDTYGQLLALQRRVDDLERSARRWPISFADGLTIVQGEFTVTGTASFESGIISVGGGPIRAIEVATFGTLVTNVSLTTSDLEVISITLTPPSWAEEMLVTAITNSQISASANQNLVTTYSIDSGGAFDGAEVSVSSGDTGNMTNPTTIIETAVSLPTAFDIDFNARVNTGTNSSNNFRMDGFVLWLRAL